MTTLGMRPWFGCRIVTKNFDYSLWPLPRLGIHVRIPIRIRLVVERRPGRKRKWHKSLWTVKRWCLNKQTRLQLLSRFIPTVCHKSVKQDEVDNFTATREAVSSVKVSRRVLVRKSKPVNGRAACVNRAKTGLQAEQTVYQYYKRLENWRPRRVGCEPVQTSRLWLRFVSIYPVLFRVIELALFLARPLFSLIYLNWNY